MIEAQQPAEKLITADTSQPTLHTELLGLARVVKPALKLLIGYWSKVEKLPPGHPYCQAASMVLRYLEKRYQV